MSEPARDEAAKEIVGFLRGIDWSTSSNEWKYERIAEIMARHKAIFEAQPARDERVEFLEIHFADGRKFSGNYGDATKYWKARAASPQGEGATQSGLLVPVFYAETKSDHSPSDSNPVAKDNSKIAQIFPDCKSQYHRPTATYCLDCLPSDAPLGALLLSNRAPTQNEIERGLEIQKLLDERQATTPPPSGRPKCELATDDYHPSDCPCGWYVAELKDWKESAMAVMSRMNLQEVGKELGVLLGQDIAAEILPGIKRLKSELAPAAPSGEMDAKKFYQDWCRSESFHKISVGENIWFPFAEAYAAHKTSSLRAELARTQEENAAMRKRIHHVEQHNQHFERCESGWCNPSPECNPALDLLKGAVVRAKQAESDLLRAREELKHK